MPKFLFRNRWFALGWVVLTLVSAGAFVAEGGGLSKLRQAPAAASRQQPTIAASDPSAVPEVLAVETEEEESAASAEGASAGSEDETESDDYVVLDDSTPIQEASDEELTVKP